MLDKKMMNRKLLILYEDLRFLGEFFTIINPLRGYFVTHLAINILSRWDRIINLMNAKLNGL
jgi:hypothetical protein